MGAALERLGAERLGPASGRVAELAVEEADDGVRDVELAGVVGELARVEAGDTVATIEAMKMEASITAAISGTVERIALSGTQAVDGGDLVLVLA